MEIVIGIVVAIVLLILIGKMKGAPDPSSMSEAAIFQRLQTESAWMSKYLGLPFSSQQSASLKRMHEEKTAYIQSLKIELARRQVAQVSHAVHSELSPIMQRAAELVNEGKSEAEANAAALREWSEKNK